MKHSFSKFAAVVFIVIISVISSCTNAPEKTELATTVSTFSIDSAKAAIAASNKLYGECFTTSDSTKFINCYTSDACIYVTNVPKMCGPQAITAFFNGAYKMGIRNLKLTTEEVTGSKEAVVETGAYELFADKGVSLDKGKYIVIWKEENGKWKMQRDIWNTDMPAPTQAK
jgi:ketosteroid isomerase-like protein